MNIKHLVKILTLILLLSWGTVAAAQDGAAKRVDLRARQTSAPLNVTPMLTWTTTPEADSCEASGGWTGSKAPAGSETLAPITRSATYRLTCKWVDGDVKVSWTPPTTNTDGSAYTDQSGVVVYYGTTSGGPYPQQSYAAHDATSLNITNLTAGTWYFAASARNTSWVESEKSSQVSHTVAITEVNASVGITVDARPGTPADLSIQ